jgi:SNF2 family DNA or RNA helicase
VIEAPPHILMRLKRVFERIDKGEHGVVSSPTRRRTPRAALVQRTVPARVRAARHLDRQADKHLERERQIELILASEYKPPDFRLALPPRDYQKIAADLTLKSGALLLADDVGLGKTVSAIAALSDARTRPAWW